MATKKRLIDANELKSQFLSYVRTQPHFHWGDWQNMCIHGTEIDEVIANAPTVDAVAVVRCKDCKHWHEETGWCYHHSHFVDADGEACHPWESSQWKMLNADDFCSYGERKDNG